jgi:hypothetical protein
MMHGSERAPPRQRLVLVPHTTGHRVGRTWPKTLRLNISDKNRRYIRKYQSKRPPEKTQRPPHLDAGLPIAAAAEGLASRTACMSVASRRARPCAPLRPQPSHTRSSSLMRCIRR